MHIQAAIEELIQGNDLSAEAMRDVMMSIMSGEISDAQIAGFLVALRMKGETVTEISTAANVMHSLSHKVDFNLVDNLVDIVGTGGDGANTFNISTAASFVVAAAGGTVAKHGNRSVSSNSGSADVLETAGINIELPAKHVAECIQQLNIGFMFAPQHHNAMRHASSVRKQLGVRTLFNLLGPLTNPAATKHQLIGVYSKRWLRPFTEVLQQLGSKHALVVHADDGLDEISLATPTTVCELHNGTLEEYRICPEDFAIDSQPLDALQVNNPEESLQMITSVFANNKGPALDIVALNAGAAIYAADLVDSLSAGITKAFDVIASGTCAEKFENLKTLTQRWK